ncbi:hypothetical protein BT69DRAFT_1286541 [Atractiella rhizophila]|nr:hypothetical protein BT69DRAFT_1286541 [Atractiella rhizophila]
MRVGVKYFQEKRQDHFVREGTAYRLLERHQGVVVPKIYGIHTYGEGRGLIVMELLEGASKDADVKDVALQRRFGLDTTIKEATSAVSSSRTSNYEMCIWEGQKLRIRFLSFLNVVTAPAMGRGNYNW